MSKRNYSRIHLRLTEDERRKLDETTLASGALYRSIFVSEALPNALQDIDVSKFSAKRKSGSYVRIPTEKKHIIKRIAETHDLTEQSIVRLYISQAVEAWRRKQVEQQNPTNKEQTNR